MPPGIFLAGLIRSTYVDALLLITLTEASTSIHDVVTTSRPHNTLSLSRHPSLVLVVWHTVSFTVV